MIDDGAGSDEIEHHYHTTCNAPAVIGGRQCLNAPSMRAWLRREGSSSPAGAESPSTWNEISTKIQWRSAVRVATEPHRLQTHGCHCYCAVCLSNPPRCNVKICLSACPVSSFAPARMLAAELHCAIKWHGRSRTRTATAVNDVDCLGIRRRLQCF